MGKGTDFPNAFTYNYDPLNRLIKAESAGIVMKESITYDEMGNINTLKRDNDNANPYHYHGNQLSYAENFTISIHTMAMEMQQWTERPV